MTFIPPSGQIYNPCRDEDGNLVATVIQYVTEIGSATECEQDVVKTIEATVEQAEELTEEEELAEIDAEIQAIREEVKNEILEELIDERLGVSND